MNTKLVISWLVQMDMNIGFVNFRWFRYGALGGTDVMDVILSVCVCHVQLCTSQRRSVGQIVRIPG